MLNDRNRFFVVAVGASALGPVSSEGAGALIRALSNRDTFKANGEACIVHHCEHIFDAMIFFADEIS